MPRKQTVRPQKKHSLSLLALAVGAFALCLYALRGFWRWFRRQSRRTQVIVASIVAVVLVISMISEAVGASNQGNARPTPSPQHSAAQASTQEQPTVVLTQHPTFLPTVKPTAKPSPSPTVRATPRPQPTQATPQPTPTKPACQAVNGNPWCYNFSPGALIYYPPAGFCSYFNCIASFSGSDDPGDGYIVECADGTYSQSGGEQGACSYHNGVLRPLYSH